jgi:peroxiredoxin
MPHLTPGDPAPWFTARTPLRPDFQFGSVAGRPLVLSFIGSAGTAPGKAMLDALLTARPGFGAANLFIVGGDGEDERQGRIVTGSDTHVFWDADGRIAALYGLAAQDAVGDAAGQPEQRLASFVLDPLLRVIRVVPLGDPATYAHNVLEALPVPPPPALQIDHWMKRRSDCLTEDERMRRQIQARLHRRRGGFFCSLLHAAQPVTQGTRYCFLPFLYDEAAAKIREENRVFVDLPKS